MQTLQLIGDVDVANKGGVALEIKERLSQELIIALVGPVGSGVSTAAGILHAALDQDFGYDVAPIMKPSDVIRAQSALVGLAAPKNARTATYISEMQDAGNKLREKFGSKSSRHRSRREQVFKSGQ